VKIRPVGAEMFHVDGRKTQTDMTQLTVTSHNFANMPKNDSSLLEVLIPQGLPLCSTAMRRVLLVTYKGWTMRMRNGFS
jgi:hypothetical protein